MRACAIGRAVRTRDLAAWGGTAARSGPRPSAAVSSGPPSRCRPVPRCWSSAIPRLFPCARKIRAAAPGTCGPARSGNHRVRQAFAYSRHFFSGRGPGGGDHPPGGRRTPAEGRHFPADKRQGDRGSRRHFVTLPDLPSHIPTARSFPERPVVPRQLAGSRRDVGIRQLDARTRGPLHSCRRGSSQLRARPEQFFSLLSGPEWPRFGNSCSAPGGCAKVSFLTSEHGNFCSTVRMDAV